MAWMEMGLVFVLRHFKARAASSAQTPANTDLSVTKVSAAVLPQHRSMGYFFCDVQVGANWLLNSPCGG